MPVSRKQDVNLPFPTSGVWESRPYDQQPQKTTVDAKNVLSYDLDEDRQRGGRRQGMSKATEGNALPARIQLLESIPVSNDAVGYPGGTIQYGASSESGVPDGTPANLSQCAIDPNQDGDTSDALGKETPLGLTIGGTDYPLTVFELTDRNPKGSDQGKRTLSHDIDPILVNFPSSDSDETYGPLQTGPYGNSCGWHVKSKDGKDGVVYFRAPFDKSGFEGDKERNRNPSKFLASRNDVPFNFFGTNVVGSNGQNDITQDLDSTNRCQVASIALPFTSENENAFRSDISKNWAAAVNIKTPCSDQYGNNLVSTYWNSSTQQRLTISADNLSFQIRNQGWSRAYRYGMVFAVRPASLSVGGGSQLDNPNTQRYLFVGFQQNPGSNNNTGEGDNQVSSYPELVIGKCGTGGNNFKLFEPKLCSVEGTEFKHAEWHELQVRYLGGILELFVDGKLATIGTNDSAQTTQLDLQDYLGAETGTTFETTRTHSGLVFFVSNHTPLSLCSSTVEPSQQFVPGDFVDNWKAVQGTAANNPSNGHLSGQVDYSGNDTLYARPGNTTASFPNVNLPLFGLTTKNSDRDPAAGVSYTFINTQNTFAMTYENHPSATKQNDFRIVFNDSGAPSEYEGNACLSVSYPAETTNGDATSGYYHNNQMWLRGADLSHRAEWGADFRRDFNEAYFHDFRFQTIDTADPSSRNVIAVSGGKVFNSINGGNSFDESLFLEDASGNPNTTLVQGVEFFSNFYMVDGTKYLVLNTANNTVSDWSALCVDADNTSTSLIPGGFNSDTETPKCTLISKHIGRIVLSGLSSFPNNWFMSGRYTNDTSASVGPNDWDITENGDAVSGTSTNVSEIGEPITSLFEFRENSLVFGCQNSIFLLTGDPGETNSSSSIQTISRDIGIVGSRAWAHGPNRSLYFFGSNGLYYLAPNQFNVSQTNRISVGRLDREFASIDLSAFNVILAYDYFLYGLHIFMSPKAQPAINSPVRHYFYDERSSALWPMEYPNTHGPTACTYYPSTDPDKRRILMGGFDGHLRFFNKDAVDDDGVAIDNFVWIGPFEVGRVTEAKVMRIASVLDAQSPGLNWEIHAGDTAEEAKLSPALATGSWNGGRNNWKHVRVRGQNIFVKLYNNAAVKPWSLENITATLAVAGRARERSN